MYWSAPLSPAQSQTLISIINEGAAHALSTCAPAGRLPPHRVWDNFTREGRERTRRYLSYVLPRLPNRGSGNGTTLTLEYIGAAHQVILTGGDALWMRRGNSTFRTTASPQILEAFFTNVWKPNPVVPMLDQFEDEFGGGDWGVAECARLDESQHRSAA